MFSGSLKLNYPQLVLSFTCIIRLACFFVSHIETSSSLQRRQAEDRLHNGLRWRRGWWGERSEEGVLPPEAEGSWRKTWGGTKRGKKDGTGGVPGFHWWCNRVTKTLSANVWYQRGLQMGTNKRFKHGVLRKLGHFCSLTFNFSHTRPQTHRNPRTMKPASSSCTFPTTCCCSTLRGWELKFPFAKAKSTSSSPRTPRTTKTTTSPALMRIPDVVFAILVPLARLVRRVFTRKKSCWKNRFVTRLRNVVCFSL